MRSSRTPAVAARSPAAALALTAALGLAAGLGIAGCAHAPRRAAPEVPEAVDQAPPTVRAEPAPEAPPAPPPEPPPEPPEERVAPVGVPPGRLDRSEEITPEELATLPDPLAPVRPNPALSAAAPDRAPEASPGASTAPSGIHPSGADSAAPAPPEGLWRVQIHASETREEAERVGRAAARRLGAALFIEREGSLYKVRLGAFVTEQEAQALRDRAVRGGYPGAFRTRARP